MKIALSTRYKRLFRLTSARWQRRAIFLPGASQRARRRWRWRISPIGQQAAFVIVTEMTDNHSMVVPLMAAALIAHATSRAICEEGICHALAKGFIETAANPPDRG